ncbi:TetR/AcrR family transcriptional regulator [Desulfovibrio inopinatus]|uniref:TetR/AcrR family transcriptional regulator n=1 Tax=Desulfovibrio inopinatus TaxID=102109 RepID=UPI000419BEAA|nr:helix-turn-helix domain-containing protein [Desulfovibrio inopinatus]
MVQVLKESVRNTIFQAAEAVFAKTGFKKTTMSAIAREASVATGTIYTYYPNKEALFLSVIPPTFLKEFHNVTQKRISAFTQPNGLVVDQSLSSDAASALLRFWIHNRLKVIILLSRSEGSPYEDFSREYIETMTTQTLQQAYEQFPKIRNSPLFSFMVEKILTDTTHGIVSILERFEDESTIVQAFEASTTYHIAGINALLQWINR